MTITKKDLTWTDHRFFCTFCESTHRAAKEMIDHDRDCLDPTDSDAEIVGRFHICLDCAGYGDEFNLTGEKVTA